MRKQLLCLGLLLIPLLQPQTVNAHAAPTQYEPEASAVLEAMPERIAITFSERPEPGASSIIVYRPAGTEAQQGRATIDPNDVRRISVGLQGSASGTYSVSWQVISADDGHFTKGAYVFSVGKATISGDGTQAQFQVIPRSTILEGVTIWIELLGQAILLGALVLLVFLWRPLRKEASEQTHERLDLRRFTALMITGVLFIVAGALWYVLLRSGDLQTGATTFQEAVRAFALTVAGKYALYRAAVALLFLGVFVSVRKSLLSSERFTKGEILLLLLVLIMALMRARVSHAAASHFLPTFSILVNFIHLLGKSLWIGGLVAFIFFIVPFLDRRKDMRLTAYALTALSKIIAVAFIVGGITGAYIIWLHLKSPANLPTTMWGLRLGGLSTMALCLVIVRVFVQRSAEVSAVRACEEGAPIFLRSLKDTVFLLTFEMVCGIFVLFLSSMILITTPPASQRALFAATAQSEGVTIRLSEHPYEDAAMLLTFEQDSEPLPMKNVIVTLTNAEHGIGPIVVTTEKRFEGGYAFSEGDLSVPGTWTAEITGVHEGSYDATAHFTLRNPESLIGNAETISSSFGIFAAIMLLGVVLISVLGVWFYRFSDKLQKRCMLTTPETIEAPSLRMPYLWPFIGISVLLLLFAYSSIGHGNDRFGKECQANGHMHHETVPMLNGQILSQTTVMGCMVGMGQGQSHFGDRREYEYSIRRMQAVAQMTTEPKALQEDAPATLSFRITDLDGKPVSDLVLAHDRILHVVIIGQDTSTFAHIHPEINKQADTLPVRYAFPKAGRYLVAATFTVRAQEFTQEFYVKVDGESKMSASESDTANVKEFYGYTVRFKAPKTVTSGSQMQKFTYTIEKDGKPVTDLQSYLAAPMHLAVVKNDLRKFFHTHGLLPQAFIDSIVNPRDPKVQVHEYLPDAFGPKIEAYMNFQTPGTYIVFGEFKHQGKVIVTKFGVEVKE